MEKSDYEHRAPEHEIGQCNDGEHAHSKYFIYGHCALFFSLCNSISLYLFYHEHRALDHEIGQCDDSEHAHSKYFIYGHCVPVSFSLYNFISISISM